ncbi:WD40 repeat-like protein [Epithele typhae]|uniref:WD40 repeat-like protein n=1 Tax=Epithele typhae TaxID=378194 RepID=UPI002007211F|nr:WD40 repeat-like protein [Epithele typhae]KAH9921964.1 WD40 repeat-like protein [Epithele typhae]
MPESSTLAVHRCRFVDFTPSAVTALCFPPLPLPSIKGKKAASKQGFPGFGPLVIGRANGNIELCEWTGSNPRSPASQAWVVHKTLAGPYSSKVESLALTFRSPRRAAQEDIPSWSNLRLFSAGGGSELVEWDIEKGCIKRTLSSQGGAIWSIASNPASTILALGCEDGSVRLVSLLYEELGHLRRLDRVKSRILSIAWGPPTPQQPNTTADSDSDDDDDVWTDSWLVTGCSDSSLRKWDFASGRVLERMGTDKVRGERTLVWAIGVVGDGTIVSGDSMGHVKFWDQRTCTQLQSFPAHAADVLCLTIGADGTSVYTSGVDQKVTQFAYVKTSRTTNDPSPLAPRGMARWVQTSSRRLHSHDVRALAIWPPHTPLPSSHQRHFAEDIAPVLVSGGLDMSVVATPAASPSATLSGKVTNPLVTSTQATFVDAYHRRLAYSSGPASGSAVHLAKDARLVLCTRDAGVTVWRIPKRKRRNEESLSDEVDPDSAKEDNWERVLDMDLNVQTNISAAAISDDGKWIAVADWYETKLFQLLNEQNGDLRPRRMRDFSSLLQGQLTESVTGASSLTFTPDSSKLIVATSMSATLVVIDLGDGARSPTVLRKFEQHRMRDNIVKGRFVKRRKHARQSTPDGDVAMADEDAELTPGADKDGAADDSGSESDSDSDASTRVHTTITRLAVSADGQWLASADARRRTHVFNLDAVQHHAALPTLPQAVHALAFDPTSPALLVLGLADNTLEVYNAEARTFPRWARALVHAVPQRFVQLHDPVLGVTFDPGRGAGRKGQAPEQGEGQSALPPKTALFWGATWMCKVMLAERVGWGGFEKRRRNKRKAEAGPDGRVEVSGAGGEEGQQGQGQQRNFKLVTHYRPILLVDFVAPGELVVVERPLVDVLAKLPPAYFKPKYGAT